MAWSVPIAGDLFGLNPQIAAGVQPPNVGSAFDSYFAGQEQARKQALQNLFRTGFIRDASGAIDWPKTAEQILQAQGPEGLQAAIAAQRFGLLRDEYNRSATQGPALPPLPPQPAPGPTPGPTSSLQPQATGDRLRPDQPGNIGGDVIGVGSTLGFAPEERPQLPPSIQRATPASFDERFSGDEGNLPAKAQPRQYTQNQPPRIYIPGPGPDEPVTPQSPTGDLGAVPGRNLTSGGFEVSERNAQRYETAADRLYQEANRRELIEKGLGQDKRAQADAYMAQAKLIRDALAKNIELTPEQKAAREAGVSQLEYARRQKAGELDVKTFQDEIDSINRGAQNAAIGQQKAALGKQLTQQPGFYSGPWNEYATTFQQFRSVFGQNPASALPNEAFNKVTNDMLQEQIKSMGQSGVGRVLMSEVGIMQRALASLGITEVSNRALLEITQRTYRKAQEIADLTRDLPPNSRQLNKVVLGYLRNHPMFTDDERRNPALLGAKEPPPDSARWSKQQMLQWGAQNGLKPGDPIMFNGRLGQIPLQAQ
jgi:hypothetical protein